MGITILNQIRDRQIFLFWAMAVGFILANGHHVFFWDTVQLGSKHAHWYYEQNFSTLWLPLSLDSGHPPAFGLYLAWMWKVFGKTLMVSHLAMLPFLLALVYALFQIGTLIAGPKKAGFLVLLAFADPTLLSQSILIGPDLVLASFFLAGILGVLKQNQLLKGFAAIGLAIISMRGMMAVLAIFLFDCLVLAGPSLFRWRALWEKTKPFVPSGLTAAAFLFLHYVQTGWVGYHPNSPWAPSFERVGLAGFLRNAILLAWRMLDYGRVLVWLVLAWGVYVGWKNNRGPLKNTVWWWGLFFLVSLCALSVSFLLYTGLNAHRYLLPVFLILTIWLFSILTQVIRSERFRKAAFILAFLGLLSGNFWIYPESIAQGWDATLAHLPYYSLRKQMLAFIDQQGIPYEEIGTAFPEIGPLKFRDLSGREEGMVEKNISAQRFIFYSNVMNDFSDEERENLKRNWAVVRQFQKRGVRVVLYGKKE